jgi:hypothetical protein
MQLKTELHEGGIWQQLFTIPPPPNTHTHYNIASLAAEMMNILYSLLQA